MHTDRAGLFYPPDSRAGTAAISNTTKNRGDTENLVRQGKIATRLRWMVLQSVTQCNFGQAIVAC